MCGGRIVDAPCSRVGHIYRQFMPYSFPPGTSVNKVTNFNGSFNVFVLNAFRYPLQNFKRVAEVWMDEYKEYFYKKRPYVRNIDPGDLTSQKQLRSDLKCKSFHWFLNEIAPDILKHYPPVVPPPAAWGKVNFFHFWTFFFHTTFSFSFPTKMPVYVLTQGSKVKAHLFLCQVATARRPPIR